MREPLLEHPTGEYETTLEALEAGLRKLLSLGTSEPLVICAQGQGVHEDAVSFADLLWHDGELRSSEPFDWRTAIEQSGASQPDAIAQAAASGSLDQCEPAALARVLDVIFRHQLGIRPFDGEGEDYPVGMEWLE